MTDWAEAPVAEVDTIVSAVCEPLLAAAGFRPGARRHWIRALAPVRHVFELVAMKGAALNPRWGISLDFVPHLRGAGLAWHRTDKSALLDLTYDPVDFEPDRSHSWSIGTLHGPAGVRRDAERVLPRAVAAAISWLDGARDPSSVLARTEWLRTANRPGGRFGFDNYVQQPLAYAFLLARTGDLEAARHELERWIALGGHEAHRQRLVTLLVG